MIRHNKFLTGRQYEVLDAIRSFISKNGYNPSVREIAAILGISTTAANSHRNALQRKGFLEFRRYTSRSTILTQPVNLPSSEHRNREGLPVTGSVISRRFTENHQNDTLLPPLALTLAAARDYWCLRFEDNSMKEQYSMKERDCLLVRSAISPISGKTCLILDEKKEVYIVLCEKKKENRYHFHWEFYSCGTTHEKIEILHPKCLGVVITLMRFSL